MSVVSFLRRLHPEIAYQDVLNIVDQYRQVEGHLQYEDTFVTFLAKNPKFDELYQISQSQMSPDLDVVKMYCDSRGFTYDTLLEMHIGYLTHKQTCWERDSLVFPYLFNGDCVGLRYRDEHGHKGGEKGCHFTLWGIDDLDRPVPSVIIVEGETDRIAVYQALKGSELESQVVIVCSPTSVFRQEWLRDLAGFRKKILIPQEDEASMKMVNKAKQYVGNELTILRLPWKRKQVGKDVCDWLRYNPPERLVGLLQGVIGDVDRVIIPGDQFEVVANKPIRWIVDNLLARRQICVVAGPQKSFKTWIMFELLRCTISGIEFASIPNLRGCGGMRWLVVEEEGSIEELYQRAALSLGSGEPDPNYAWQKHTWWAHHLEIKLDSEAWIERLEAAILENNIDGLILDPFQRMHSVDENSAKEMGVVWDAIHYLTGRFSNLTIVILHHFTKAGSILDGWEAFRGSSRTAGEADVAFFVERRPLSDGIGARIRFDGRSIPPILGPDGKDIFKLHFDDKTGRMSMVASTIQPVQKWQQFVDDLEQQDNQEWAIADAAVFYGVSINTLNSWITKAQSNNIPIEKIPPKPGSGAKVRITYGDRDD